MISNRLGIEVIVVPYPGTPVKEESQMDVVKAGGLGEVWIVDDRIDDAVEPQAVVYMIYVLV